MRNVSSVLALLAALAALALFVGAGYVAREYAEVSWLKAALAVPLVALLGFFSLALASRGYGVHQRTLGRVGGAGVAGAARVLGTLALLLATTAGLALAVFGVLLWTDGLSRAPW